MARVVDSATAGALGGEKLWPIGMVELDFRTPAQVAADDQEEGFFRVWSGLGTLQWTGHVWTGIGDLGRIGNIEETVEVRAVGVDMELSSIPAEILEIAISQTWQGRAARVYYGVLQGRTFVGEPLQIFAGLMDRMTLIEGEQATIRLSCESNQIDLERTRARRFTAEDQRAEYPDDAGCDAVAAIQEAQIAWGRA